MQSGPSKASPQQPLNQIPSTTPESSKYGQQHELHRAPRSPPREERASSRNLDETQKPHVQDMATLHIPGEAVYERLQKLRVSTSGSLLREAGEIGPPVWEERESSAFGDGRSKTTSTSTSEALFETLPSEILIQVVSHLPPSSLSAVALVSRQFHSLVDSPHAWRIAFGRLFAGQNVLGRARYPGWHDDGTVLARPSENIESDNRSFSRLTALASWRSEYILRTRLLQCLARGKPELDLKPIGAYSRSAMTMGGRNAVTFSSGLNSPVTHIQASSFSPQSKRLLRFMIAADEIGCARRMEIGAIRPDSWGTADHQLFSQFSQRFPGQRSWGLDEGTVVGVPNMMDLSYSFGIVHGEGFPGGLVYFRSTEEKRGRFLPSPTLSSNPERAIPEIPSRTEAICSVWIAKSVQVTTMTDGLLGMLCGSSIGVLTGYSLGTRGIHNKRLSPGEITARWVLSPGVPIIAIVVDDSYNQARHAAGRYWIAVLNALGEVFCLSGTPIRPQHVSSGLGADELEALAWETGRTVRWELIELSKRVMQPDPYDELKVNGNSCPRTSWGGMALGKDQLVAETKAIEKYFNYKPIHFQKAFRGWDMRRRFEVDFAGDGQNIRFSCFLICYGYRQEPVEITRYSSCSRDRLEGSDETCCQPETGVSRPRLSNTSGIDLEWRVSELCLGLSLEEEITTTAIDNSGFSLLTADEDPLVRHIGLRGSTTSETTTSKPLSDHIFSLLPGQRARFIAAGTNAGRVFLWNGRAPVSSNAELANILRPLRIIQTDSQRINSLALTALYLVHGGDDGLVQAWDPLASGLSPIRTLNSRFSSRSRRRLVSAEGNGRDLRGATFAANAIVLDSDPTMLRGMVALGPHLRYWSYSSSDVDQYTGRSRRLRRSRRRDDYDLGRFAEFGRASVDDYISSETHEFVLEERRRAKEAGRLAGRFGVGLLGHGANEEDVLAYAKMLSQESFAQDEEKRRSGSDSTSAESVTMSSSHSGTVTPEGVMANYSSPAFTSPSAHTPHHDDEDEDDDDDEFAEAIRRSLFETGENDPSTPVAGPSSHRAQREIPIRYAKARATSKRKTASPSSSSPPSSSRYSGLHQAPSSGHSGGSGSGSGIAATGGDSSSGDGTGQVDDDLNLALQLSLAQEDEFPSLATSVSPPIEHRLDVSSSSRKGKRKVKGKQSAR